MADLDYRRLSMDEIVFEKRNKDYGAFELRNIIDRHKLTGLLVAIGLFCFVVLSSQFKLFAFLSELTKEKEVNITYRFFEKIEKHILCIDSYVSIKMITEAFFIDLFEFNKRMLVLKK